VCLYILFFLVIIDNKALRWCYCAVKCHYTILLLLLLTRSKNRKIYKVSWLIVNMGDQEDDFFEFLNSVYGDRGSNITDIINDKENASIDQIVQNNKDGEKEKENNQIKEELDKEMGFYDGEDKDKKEKEIVSKEGNLTKIKLEGFLKIVGWIQTLFSSAYGIEWGSSKKIVHPFFEQNDELTSTGVGSQTVTELNESKIDELGLLEIYVLHDEEHTKYASFTGIKEVGYMLEKYIVSFINNKDQIKQKTREGSKLEEATGNIVKQIWQDIIVDEARKLGYDHSYGGMKEKAKSDQELFNSLSDRLDNYRFEPIKNYFMNEVGIGIKEEVKKPEKLEDMVKEGKVAVETIDFGEYLMEDPEIGKMMHKVEKYTYGGQKDTEPIDMKVSKYDPIKKLVAPYLKPLNLKYDKLSNEAKQVLNDVSEGNVGTAAKMLGRMSNAREYLLAKRVLEEKGKKMPPTIFIGYNPSISEVESRGDVTMNTLAVNCPTIEDLAEAYSSGMFKDAMIVVKRGTDVDKKIRKKIKDPPILYY